VEDRYSIAPVTGVKIDLIQVPRDKRRHSKYLSELADLRGLLSQHEFLDLFSLHETGHIIYFERAGVTQFDYIGPLIAYFPGTAERADDFLGQWAAVKPNNFVEPPRADEDSEGLTKWLLDHAKGYAAGGVVSRKLTTTSYAGDRRDRRQFGELCNAAYNADARRFMDVEGMWVDAQEKIEKDLNDREFEQTIRTRMLDIKQRLYFSATP
jgi:hypothetical protein